MQELTIDQYRSELRKPLISDAHLKAYGEIGYEARTQAEEQIRNTRLEPIKLLIEDISNSYDESNLQALAKLLRRTHRTLEQNIFRDFVLPYLQSLATDYAERRYDARNEDACKAASVAVQAIKDADLGFRCI